MLVVIIALALFFKPILPVVEYIINYDYITKVLCINKAQPNLQCNGKCHLMKELAKASENEKPISSDKKIAFHENEVLFFQIIEQVQIAPIFYNATQNVNSNYSNLYFLSVSSSVFHPPTIIS
jgi:hypothetical protein